MFEVLMKQVQSAASFTALVRLEDAWEHALDEGRVSPSQADRLRVAMCDREARLGANFDEAFDYLGDTYATEVY